MSVTATPEGSTTVVVFTRDLRLRDHPALCAAADADTLLPLFVLDDAIAATMHRSANRSAFLADCLADLRDQLREQGTDLVVRSGDWVEEVVGAVERSGASRVHLSEDSSAFAQRRAEALRAALPERVEVHEHPGITVVPPGSTAPSGGGPWKVFTPFHRRWTETTWRHVMDVPTLPPLPQGTDPGALPDREALVDRQDREDRQNNAGAARGATVAPGLQRGGERPALAVLKEWAADHLAEYDDRHDDLPGDATSHVSAHLHFGTLSPLEVASRLRSREGGAAFVRQLCWRDFYHQVLAARPETATVDYRPRGDRWRDDPDEIDAWREGRTGFPVVDAGMRQLRDEGFMHNRARMIVASFLTKDLYVDWRIGAAHFMELLVDGDVANNQLNWQWTAGTGTDSNPNRIFNPTVQSKRFDPDGNYIRRYVVELADVAAPEIHEPSDATRARVGYPSPLVDHHSAIELYRAQLAEAKERRDH